MHSLETEEQSQVMLTGVLFSFLKLSFLRKDQASNNLFTTKYLSGTFQTSRHQVTQKRGPSGKVKLRHVGFVLSQ